MSEEPREEHDELPAPGWFVDPERPGMLRWWDGRRWTEHLVVDPDADADPARPAASPRAWRPDSGSSSTPTETTGWAVASLVLGVLALTPGAIICGIVAKRRIRASRGKIGGDALANAGIGLGIVYTLLFGGVALQAFLPQDNAPHYTGQQKPVAALVDGVGRALARDDGDRACSTLFTATFARRVARGSGQDCPSFVADAVAGGDFEARLRIESIEITGASARVEVTEGSDRQSWSLDRVRGSWRVDDISA